MNIHLITYQKKKKKKVFQTCFNNNYQIDDAKVEREGSFQIFNYSILVCGQHMQHLTGLTLYGFRYHGIWCFKFLSYLEGTEFEKL